MQMQPMVHEFDGQKYAACTSWLRTLALCLAATACASGVAPSPTRPERPVSRAATLSPSTDDQKAQWIVRSVLAQSDQPVAAAVLSVNARRPMALEGHLGADPAMLAARPGSTVKPILAWLAAEAGVLTSNQTQACDITFDDGFRCFAAHGTLTLPEAIAVSCNVYAFELAKRLGLERIASGFAQFGFGKRTGFVAKESAGFLADPQWAKSKGSSPNERWDLLVGTGHGPIEVTPLQLTKAYAELIGRLAAPSPFVSDRLRWEITDGLRRVVEDQHGTAHTAAVEGLQIGGKTGTAEAGAYGDTGDTVNTNNSWFVGLAPLKAPQVVVAVLVLGGASRGNPAAPIAGRILDGLARESIILR
jgi:beta-lactamase class D